MHSNVPKGTPKGLPLNVQRNLYCRSVIEGNTAYQRALELEDVQGKDGVNTTKRNL